MYTKEAYMYKKLVKVFSEFEEYFIKVSRLICTRKYDQKSFDILFAFFLRCFTIPAR